MPSGLVIASLKGAHYLRLTRREDRLALSGDVEVGILDSRIVG
jgi:hypothetical protein